MTNLLAHISSQISQSWTISPDRFCVNIRNVSSLPFGEFSDFCFNSEAIILQLQTVYVLMDVLRFVYDLKFMKHLLTEWQFLSNLSFTHGLLCMAYKVTNGQRPAVNMRTKPMISRRTFHPYKLSRLCLKLACFFNVSQLIQQNKLTKSCNKGMV